MTFALVLSLSAVVLLTYMLFKNLQKLKQFSPLISLNEQKISIENEIEKKNREYNYLKSEILKQNEI